MEKSILWVGFFRENLSNGKRRPHGFGSDSGPYAALCCSECCGFQPRFQSHNMATHSVVIGCPLDVCLEGPSTNDTFLMRLLSLES